MNNIGLLSALMFEPRKAFAEIDARPRSWFPLLAVVFTWLYNRSRGGLWVVILLHTSVNNTSGYWLPVNIGLTIALLIVAATLVVTDRMYLRPRMPRPPVAASAR